MGYDSGNLSNLTIPETPHDFKFTRQAAKGTGSDKDLRNAAGWVASKAVRILTKNEPIKMPGQSPRPNNRMPAKAMPAGDQSAVAYSVGIANSKAILPTTKYVRPRPPV